MDEQLRREVVAVILACLALLILLAAVGLAGQFGRWLIGEIFGLFGWATIILPLTLIVASWSLWRQDEEGLKVNQWLGVILFPLSTAAMLHPAGGNWGRLLAEQLFPVIGTIPYYLIFLTLTLLTLILMLNTSLKNTLSFLWPWSLEISGGKNNGQEAKVSVFTTKNEVEKTAVERKTIVPITNDWRFPPLDLLSYSDTRADAGNVAKNVEIIQKTLQDFGIPVAMGDVNVGPVVTQYTFKPAEGVKLTNIVARSNDLSLSLAAHPIRIEAPIPGKAAVGIEVPNKISAIVTLREMLESKEFKTNRSHLSLSLGRDAAGVPVVRDIKPMPHLLIAGATGSGKSICMHALIVSLLYQNSPADLRLILIDPKRVEFTYYNGLPHLLAPVITDVDKTISALKWIISEMDRRFDLLQRTAHRDIESYNQKPDAEDGRLPYLVVIIDELADLMAQAANEVEGAIVRLAQLARATGIHLILATQRPSVDVITGLIKANITSRIAFAVASGVDSRTILDASGAEKLLGKGDMLFLGNDLGKPRRAQGSFITDKEIQVVVDFIKQQQTAHYNDSVTEFYTKSGGWSGSAGGEVDDEIYGEAKEIVVQSGKASASLLQRRLRIGYARAARLLDIMEEQGIIGPADGARPRDILSQNVLAAPERKQGDGF